MQTGLLERLCPLRVGGDGGAGSAGDGERVANHRAAVSLLEVAQEVKKVAQEPALEDEAHGLHAQGQLRHHEAVAEVLDGLRLRHQTQRQNWLSFLT